MRSIYSRKRLKVVLIVISPSGGIEDVLSLFVCDFLKEKSLKCLRVLYLNEIRLVLIDVWLVEVSLRLN